MRNKALIVLVAPLLAACSTNQVNTTAWDAPTRVRFGSVRADDVGAIEQVFARHDLGAKRVSSSPLAYDLTGINSTREFAQVKSDLDATLKSRGLDAPLEFAMISYASADAMAQTRSTIEVTVPPGSRLYIADQSRRNPWREVTPTPSGSWKGLIHTSTVVADAGGWVYVTAKKDGFDRYSRVSAFNGKQEAVSYVTLRDAGLNEPFKAPPASTNFYATNTPSTSRELESNQPTTSGTPSNTTRQYYGDPKKQPVHADAPADGGFKWFWQE